MVWYGMYGFCLRVATVYCVCVCFVLFSLCVLLCVSVGLWFCVHMHVHVERHLSVSTTRVKRSTICRSNKIENFSLKMCFKRIGMYYIMIAKRTKVHSPTSSSKRMLGSSEATVKSIEESAARISDIALRTPLAESKWLSVENKCNVYLKLESEQINGSFKLRGATNKLKLLQQRARDNGTVRDFFVK